MSQHQNHSIRQIQNLKKLDEPKLKNMTKECLITVSLLFRNNDGMSEYYKRCHH